MGAGIIRLRHNSLQRARLNCPAFLASLFLCCGFLLAPSTGECAARIEVSPDTFAAETGGWLTVSADVVREAQVEIKVFIDYDNDRILHSPDHLVRYLLVQEGTAQDDEDPVAGGLTTRLNYWGGAWPAGHYIITVDDKQGAVTAGFAIEQTATSRPVSGFIKNLRGSLLPGIVRAMRQEPGTENFTELAATYTDSSGAYILYLPSGQIDLTGESDGMLTEFSRRIQIDAEVNDFPVQVNPVVTGTDQKITGLIEVDHTPVPFVRMLAEAGVGEELIRATTLASEAGVFVLPASAGVWQVCVDGEDLNTRAVVGNNCRSGILVESELDVTGVAFRLTDATASISGRVRSINDSTQFPGITIAANGNKGTSFLAATSTGPDGFYQLHVASGTWVLEADWAGFSEEVYALPGPITVTVNVGESVENTDFILEQPDGWFRIFTLDSATSEPIANVPICIEEKTVGDLGTFHTSADGMVTLDAEAGSYTLSLWSEEFAALGYGPVPSREVSVQTGVNQDVIFFLERTSATLSVEVVDQETSAPIAGVEVIIESAEITDQFLASRSTNDAGIAEFTLTSGTYVVVLGPDSLLSQGYGVLPKTTATVLGGQSNLLRMTALRPSATVFATVTEAETDLPVEGVGVRVRNVSNNIAASGLTDILGQVRIEVIPGIYSVELDPDDVTVRNFAIPEAVATSVTHGQTAAVTFALTSADNEIPTLEIDTPITNVQVPQSRSGILFAGTANDPDGSIVLLTYRVQVGVWQEVPVAENWSFVPTLPMGRNLIEVRVQDNAGDWSGIQSRIVERITGDAVPPVLTVDNPATNMAVSNETSTTLFRGRHLDTDGTVVRVEWSQNNEPWMLATLLGENEWQVMVSLEEGANTLDARAWDNEGRFSQITRRTINRELSSALPVPQNVRATDGVYPEHVRVMWDRAGDALYHRVYRSDTEEGESTALGDWGTNVFFDDNGVNPGTRYWYWVRASNSPDGAVPSLLSDGVMGRAASILPSDESRYYIVYKNCELFVANDKSISIFDTSPGGTVKISRMKATGSVTQSKPGEAWLIDCESVPEFAIRGDIGKIFSEVSIDRIVASGAIYSLIMKGASASEVEVYHLVEVKMSVLDGSEPETMIAAFYASPLVASVSLTGVSLAGLSIPEQDVSTLKLISKKVRDKEFDETFVNTSGMEDGLIIAGSVKSFVAKGATLTPESIQLLRPSQTTKFSVSTGIFSLGERGEEETEVYQADLGGLVLTQVQSLTIKVKGGDILAEAVSAGGGISNVSASLKKVREENENEYYGGAIDGTTFISGIDPMAGESDIRSVSGARYLHGYFYAGATLTVPPDPMFDDLVIIPRRTGSVKTLKTSSSNKHPFLSYIQGASWSKTPVKFKGDPVHSHFVEY